MMEMKAGLRAFEMTQDGIMEVCDIELMKVRQSVNFIAEDANSSFLYGSDRPVLTGAAQP
jgi:hypothetical protein